MTKKLAAKLKEDVVLTVSWVLAVASSLFVTLDKEYIGYIDWEFMVEELPISPYDPTVPKTGDNANIWLYASTMGVSLALCFLFFFVARRRKKAE